MQPIATIMTDKITRQGKDRASGQDVYMTTLEDQVIMPLNTLIPIMTEREGCIGLARPFELHISAQGTIIFFTLTAGGNKQLKAIMNEMYGWNGGSGSVRWDPSRGKADRDTARTGMDAATRMMTGMGKDPREMARDGRRGHVRRDPDEPVSMADVVNQLWGGNPPGMGEDDDDDDY